MESPTSTSLSTLVAASAFAGISAAQTLWGIDLTTPGGPPMVHELARPSDPLRCNFPAPSPLTSFPALASGSCDALGLDYRADVTVDRANGVVYAGTGFRIARFTLDGAFLDSFGVRIIVHGMCVNPESGRIWITDGGAYGAIDPPPIPSCGQLVPFATGPFLVPTGAGWFENVLSDFDFDPATNSLVGCAVGGVVGSILPRPVPRRGPYPFVRVTSGACTLGPPTGIALDHARPGSGIFWVTDGFTLAYLQPGGAAAPPTHYAPATCTPVPTGMLSGLAYTARPVRYGQGSDTAGLTPPRIGAVGEARVPNPDFAFTLSGSVPGATALLFYGVSGAACPPQPSGGVAFLARRPFQCLGVAAVDAAGAARLATPVGANVPPGLSGWVQWLVATPAPSLQASDALEVVFATP